MIKTLREGERVFIERLEIDKEKIIIGWGDLCNFASWIFDNWSWGFFIAVLSLWFTAKALKKTDKANKLASDSLELTKRSTDIAEKSLQAAKKSINTSIELYEKQKNYEEDRKNKIEEREIKAIRKSVANELARASYLIVQMYELRNKLDGEVSKVTCDIVGKIFIIKIHYFDEKIENIYLHADGSNIPFDVILKASTLDDNLYMDLTDVKLQLNILEKQLNFCIDTTKINNYLLLKNYLDLKEFKDLMLRHYDVINYFSNEMEGYDIYQKLKNAITLW